MEEGIDMTKLFLKTISILLCLALLTTGVSAEASANANIPGPDLTFSDGSLTVELTYNSIKLNNIRVSVCLVAEMEWVKNKLRYDLTGDFTDSVDSWPMYMDKPDTSVPYNRILISGEELAELAEELYSYAVSNNITRDMKTTGADGKVLFGFRRMFWVACKDV